ncbi:MAG: carboxypeptidase M32 [Ruminococcaceae bacterium]|nr:carboxypeptidase M32 [Oscillospiraceae bacterium]
MTREEALSKLSQYDKQTNAIGHAMGIMYYDAATVAPKGSAQGRAETLGQLAGMIYELETSPEREEIIEVLFKEKDELSFIDRRKIEEIHEGLERMKKIPKELFTSYQMLSSEADAVWHEAKEKDDFAMFEPLLQKMFDMSKEIYTYTDPDKDPYDAALNSYEKGLTKERCDEFFAALRAKIVPLIKKIGEKEQIDDSILHLNYPKLQQQKFSEYLIDIMDINRDNFVIGETEHPFTTDFTKRDVRITTNYHEDSLASSLYSVVHECGHALYELNTADELINTGLGSGVSMAIHESQSRFYENIIGRSEAFTNLIFPFLKKEFPEQFKDLDAKSFYKMINKAEPSLIRTEADELTYSLHVMVRYELEKAMFKGEIKAKDLPEMWKKLYKEYLGVEVPSDKQGVLQDSHWSNGNIGYFPSYALGSAYGPQMLIEMEKELNLNDEIASGKLTKINDWLREKIWKHGCLYTPTELFEMVCGKFDPVYYTDYLEKKFSEIYGL